MSPVEPLGLKRGELLVVPYDHRWSALVDEAAAELVAPLGSSILFARAYVTHSRPIRSTEVDSIITATVDALLNSPLGRNRNLAPGMARTWVEFDFYRPVERPAVTDLFVGRRGDIWLQESDLGDVWLRLGADGQPLQRIEFPADVTLFQADGDLIWGSEVDALGVPYAVRYRVPGT